jgi:hypothetical protein
MKERYGYYPKYTASGRKGFHVEISLSGKETWFSDNAATIRHRPNGPAVIHPDGTKEFWLYGKKYSEEEYKQRIGPAPEEGKEIVVDGRLYRLVPVNN